MDDPDGGAHSYCESCGTVESQGAGQASLDGVAVTLYRSELGGPMRVLIETHDASDSDHHDSGAPRLRVLVNDDPSEIAEDGSWFNPEETR